MHYLATRFFRGTAQIICCNTCTLNALEFERIAYHSGGLGANLLVANRIRGQDYGSRYR